MMDYKPWIAGEATRALLAQPPRRRLLMEDALRWLAANPFVDPDFSVMLPDGRVCGVVCREKVILTFWVDHATRELRIVDIELVQPGRP